MRRASLVYWMLLLSFALLSSAPALALGKPAWAKPYLTAPSPAGGYIAKNDEWVIVYAEVEYSLSDSGALRQYRKYIYENRRDKPKFFMFGVSYDEGAQNLSELQVNVDRGSHWSAIDVEDHSIKVGKERGAHALFTSVSEVEPGMRVVLEYFLQDKFNLLPFERHGFLAEAPTAQVTLKIASKDNERLKMRLILPPGDTLPPSFSEGPGQTLTARNLPANSRLPRGYALQPGNNSLYPWAVIYAVPTGSEDAAFIGAYAKAWEEARKKLAQDQISPRAKTIVGDAATPAEKLRKIGDFVQHEILYDDSNNDSIHAWVPLEVGETLRSMKGDCKGKTLMAQSLLAAVGVESKPVLLRMDTHYYRWEKEPATAPLNHVILAVRADAAKELPGTLREGPAAGWVLCDPVMLTAGFGEALPMYEGLSAFLVGAEGEPRFTIRTAEPSAEKAAIRVSFKVAPTGAISGQLTLRDNGASQLSLELSEKFTAEEINTAVVSAFPAVMNRVQLQEAKVLRADKEGNGLFELRAKFNLPNASQTLGDSLMVASPVALACDIFGLPNGYWPPTPPCADDKVELLPPWDNKKNAHGVEQLLEVEAELELPTGFVWSPPAPRKESAPALECDYTWTQERPGLWKAHLKLARHRGYWPVQERKGRLKAEDALFAELSKTIELKRG